MPTQKTNSIKSIKFALVMLAAAVLTIAPIMQLSLQNSVAGQSNTSAGPLTITKEVDTKSPLLYEPFNYTIKITNNSDKTQRVNFNDVNTNPFAQNFESFVVEGAIANSTLEIKTVDKTTTDENGGGDDEVPADAGTIPENASLLELKEIYDQKVAALAKPRQALKNAKKTIANKQNAVNTAQNRVAAAQKAVNNAKKPNQKAAAQKSLNQARTALNKAQKNLNQAKVKVNFAKKEQNFKNAQAAAKAAREAFNRAALADPSAAALQQAVNQAQAAKNAAQTAFNQAQQRLNVAKREVPAGKAQAEKNIETWRKKRSDCKKQACRNEFQAKIDNAWANIKKLNDRLHNAQVAFNQAKNSLDQKTNQLAAAQEVLDTVLLGDGLEAEDAEDDVTEEEVTEEIEEEVGEGNVVVDVEQRLEGAFDLPAGATVTIKLTAMITDELGDTDTISNSATVLIDGQPITSNETKVRLCQTTECGEVVEPESSLESSAQKSNDGGLPAAIASTGPGAVAASVVGVSALGYGARQWIASRRAMHEAMKNLYKPEHHDQP